MANFLLNKKSWY